MTASLYRVTAGPHAGFVGYVDTVWSGGYLLLSAGHEFAIVQRSACEPATAPRRHAPAASFAEAAVRLHALIALGNAARPAP